MVPRTSALIPALIILANLWSMTPEVSGEGDEQLPVGQSIDRQLANGALWTWIVPR